jgi:hypothetical protein
MGGLVRPLLLSHIVCQPYPTTAGLDNTNAGSQASKKWTMPIRNWFNKEPLYQWRHASGYKFRHDAK